MWANNIKRNIGTRCDKENIVLDLTGQTFGDWTVLEYVGNKKYLCECSCENHTRKVVRKANLINGSSTSCGHNRNSYGDLTGRTFGDWTVLRKKGYQWECICSCDDTKTHLLTHLLYAADLVNGKTINKTMLETKYNSNRWSRENVQILYKELQCKIHNNLHRYK